MAHHNTKHGESQYGSRRPSPEYVAYSQMMARCYCTTNKAFHRYGGRGVAVCDRWRAGDGSQTGFQCFVTDMGRRPTPDHSLDRRDNDLGYSPENCRWATPLEQSRNKRGLRMVEYAGRTVPLSQACEMAGLSYGMVKRRINALGWTAERALSTPSARCHP